MSEIRAEQVWGAFVLRFALGMMFFFFGIGKFMMGLATFRGYLAGQFAKGWLPNFMVTGFGTVLPFLEVIIGALLLLGLFRFFTLIVGSLLMLALTFGTVVTSQTATVANNMVYVAYFAAVLFTSRWDLIALDTLLFRPRDIKGF